MTELQADRSARPHTPCFTAGTIIATARGPVAIDDLRVGDCVLTRDRGYRPIRWIGARLFDAASLVQFDDLRPIRIRAGALGDAGPTRDIGVSPQHRMLLTGERALELAGEGEVLITAQDLVSLGLAEPMPCAEVTYYHMLFDQHEIVLANGCWSESFLPEPAAIDGLHQAQQQEILRIFPELCTLQGQAAYAIARRAVSVPMMTDIAA